MKQTVIKFGLISGAILAFCMAVTFLVTQKLGLGHSLIVGYATMVVSFTVVYFGVRSYRDNNLGGRISFGTAFKTGILISLITCVFYVAAWEVMYFGGMVGDFEKSYTDSVLAKERAAGASAAKLDSTAADMKKAFANYKNPFYNSAMTFLEPLPVAIIFTLLSAAMLSRKRKELAGVNGGLASGVR